MLEIKERTVKDVNIYGQDFKVRKLTVDEAIIVQKESSKLSEEDTADFMIKTVGKLGIDETFLRKMDVDDLGTLSEYILGKKK